MKAPVCGRLLACAVVLLGTFIMARDAKAEGDWEITPESRRALDDGLGWLARNQGAEGNWESNDLGLVGMGVLAFLADGHMPGRGRYGRAVERALAYIIEGARPGGLLNRADPRRGMYNHGLSTFVLGQAYGMSGDRRVGTVLDRALELICQTQCADGGWDYQARSQARGHDLSLAVMQAKALRSAVDSGFEVPPEVVDLAIGSVRRHYAPEGCSRSADEAEQRKHPGQFTYTGGGNGTLAMAAAGVVCLQEFGQYDDWRIEKSMKIVCQAIREKAQPKLAKVSHKSPFEAYTLYYVGQALYQRGGKDWRECYPLLRDSLVAGQIHNPDQAGENGLWRADGSRLGGKPGDLYTTAVACFVLAMPNRYLPILQEGKIESLRKKYGGRSP